MLELPPTTNPTLRKMLEARPVVSPLERRQFGGIALLKPELLEVQTDEKIIDSQLRLLADLAATQPMLFVAETFTSNYLAILEKHGRKSIAAIISAVIAAETSEISVRTIKGNGSDSVIFSTQNTNGTLLAALHCPLIKPYLDDLTVEFGKRRLLSYAVRYNTGELGYICEKCAHTCCVQGKWKEKSPSSRMYRTVLATTLGEMLFFARENSGQNLSESELREHQLRLVQTAKSLRQMEADPGRHEAQKTFTALADSKLKGTAALFKLVKTYATAA